MLQELENLESQFGPLDPEQKSKLNEAHKLVAQRQYQVAANIFSDLASEMEDANHNHQAATFHCQAAYAYADCHFEEAALSHARTALILFMQSHLKKQAKNFYLNITQILTNRDMKVAMEAIQKEFGAKLDVVQADLNEYLVARNVHLLDTCPKCGALINSTEVHWIDDNTAECNYCGAQLRDDSDNASA